MQLPSTLRSAAVLLRLLVFLFAIVFGYAGGRLIDVERDVLEQSPYTADSDDRERSAMRGLLSGVIAGFQ